MSYTKLLYHLITATKQRKPYLEGDIEDLAYSCLRSEAKNANGEIYFIGGIEDHVHMITSIHQTVAVSDFVRDVKAEASKAINREFPELGFEWQIGYGAFTVSHFDMGELVKYVLNQKEHHAEDDLWAKFEKTS